MQARNRARPVSIGRLGLPLLALALTAACSPGAQRPSALTTDTATGRADSPRPAAAIAELAEDPGGFTIVQQVNVTDDVRNDYETALRMLDASRYEPAIGLLLDVTERAPTATAVQIALGVAYSRSGDLENARTHLDRALELSPRHPVALNELGLVLRRMGLFEESRVSYQAALERFADFHYAHKNLAILCDLYLGDHACALEHYGAYNRLVPNDPEVGKWIVDLRNRTDIEVMP